MKKLAAFVLAALVIIAVAAAVTARFLVRRSAPDAPPPDDEHLMVERADVPEDQNAFTVFITLTNMWFEKEQYADRLDDLLDGRIWEEALVEKVLNINQGIFYSIEEGLKWPHCQVPEIRNAATSTAYLNEWRRIAKLMRLRARLFLVQGKHVQAFEQALAVVHFGQRIEESGGALIHYLVGLSIKHMGLILIEQMLPYLKPDPVQFRVYAAKLAEFGANEEALIRSIKMEYQLEKNTIADLAEGQLSLKAAGVSAPPPVAAMGVTPFLLQPHITQRRFVDFYTQLLEAAPLVQKEAARIMPSVNRAEIPLREAFVKPNYIGRALAASLLPPSLTIVERKNGEQLYLDSVRLRFLIIAYEMENSAPPPSLDELVGENLERVPTDPYDGKPLRYSSSRRMVYSVGRDLEDSGGSSAAPSAPAGLPDQQKRWLAEDIVFGF